MINTLKIIKKSMKRHYELVCRRRVEFLSDIFPDLVKEEDDSFTENITLNDDKNADEYSINFVFDNSLKPDYYFTALKYFGEGKDFSFLIWQDFQQFIFVYLLRISKVTSRKVSLDRVSMIGSATCLATSMPSRPMA